MKALVALLLILTVLKAQQATKDVGQKAEKGQLIPIESLRPKNQPMTTMRKGQKANNQMRMIKKKVKKTAAMLEEAETMNRKKKRNRSILAKHGLYFFKDALVKTKAIELNEKGKIITYNAKTVGQVVKALRNRATEHQQPSMSKAKVQCPLNFAMNLGKLAKSVYFDPDQPYSAVPNSSTGTLIYNFLKKIHPYGLIRNPTIIKIWIWELVI